MSDYSSTANVVSNRTAHPAAPFAHFVSLGALSIDVTTSQMVFDIYLISNQPFMQL